MALSDGAQVLSEPHKGYGAACLAGIAALPEEVEIIFFLDADYSDYPEEMEKLVTPILRKQTDFVVGSRMVYPAASAALTPQQRWGNWLATRLIRLLFGYRYSNLIPFRAIRKRPLESLRRSDRADGCTAHTQIKTI